MAIRFLSIKCPECMSNLSIEEGRGSAFCTYCGTKIMISNDNEHILRTIDEARIKEAETDRIIKLRKLDLAEKNVKKCHPLPIIWMIIGIILIAIAVVGFIIENIPLAVTSLVIGLLISIVASIVIGVINRRII